MKKRERRRWIEWALTTLYNTDEEMSLRDMCAKWGVSRGPDGRQIRKEVARILRILEEDGVIVVTYRRHTHRPRVINNAQSTH